MEIFKIKWLILPVLMLLTGCAVRPVETDLAVTHPANPRAESAPFAPPVNVFESDASFARKTPAADPMTHKQHGKSEGKHMNHHQQPMKMESQPSRMPDMEKTESEHKEHGQ